jgi:putative transposase
MSAMARPHRLTSDAYHGGFRYFLTICTHRRRPHFRDAAVVELVRLEFLHTAAAHSFAIVLDCYMPDHIHVVVEGASNESDLRRFVKLAKQRSGFHFARVYDGPLWQESYFDRTLRRDESLSEVLRYVLLNPVRAGLVEDPRDYLHWGSGIWTRSELLDFVGLDQGRV